MKNVEKYKSIAMIRDEQGREIVVIDGVVRNDIEDVAEWMFQEGNEHDKG